MHKLQLKILACYKIGCATYCIEIKINKILNMKKYKSLEWTEKVEILEVIYKAKPDWLYWLNAKKSQLQGKKPPIFTLWAYPTKHAFWKSPLSVFHFQFNWMQNALFTLWGPFFRTISQAQTQCDIIGSWKGPKVE